MTAALSINEVPTGGEVGFRTYDTADLWAALDYLEPTPGVSLPHPDYVLSKLRRIADALYASRVNVVDTAGAAGPLSFDWTIALEEAESIEEVIGAVSKRLASQTTDRIKYLHSFEAPPVRGREPISLISLKSAVLFLIRNDELPNPSITVTAAGHVLLEWARSQYRYFAVEFLEDESAVYFLLIHGRNRIRGRTAMSDLTSIAPPKLIKVWYSGKAKQTGSARRSRC